MTSYMRGGSTEGGVLACFDVSRLFVCVCRHVCSHGEEKGSERETTCDRGTFLYSFLTLYTRMHSQI